MRCRIPRIAMREKGKKAKVTRKPTLRRKRARRAVPAIAVDEADRDLLDQYLFEVSQTPLLKPPEEIALAKKVRSPPEA